MVTARGQRAFNGGGDLVLQEEGRVSGRGCWRRLCDSECTVQTVHLNWVQMRSWGGAGCRAQALPALGPSLCLTRKRKGSKQDAKLKKPRLSFGLRPHSWRGSHGTFWNVSPDPSLLEPPWVAGGWRKAPRARGEALSSVPSGKAASLPAT